MESSYHSEMMVFVFCDGTYYYDSNLYTIYYLILILSISISITYSYCRSVSFVCERSQINLLVFFVSFGGTSTSNHSVRFDLPVCIYLYIYIYIYISTIIPVLTKMASSCCTNLSFSFFQSYR